MGGKEEENIYMTQDEERQGEDNTQEKEGDLGGQTGIKIELLKKTAGFHLQITQYHVQNRLLCTG